MVSGDERESRTEMGFVYSVAELSVRSCVVEDSVSSGQEGPRRDQLRGGEAIL